MKEQTKTLKESLENQLRERNDTILLDTLEIINDGVIHSGVNKKETILHAINFAVTPSQELYTSKTLDKWLKSLKTVLPSMEGTEIKYENPEWNMDSEDHSLGRLFLGHIKVYQHIGLYEGNAKLRFEHTTKISDPELSKRLFSGKKSRTIKIEQSFKEVPGYSRLHVEDPTHDLSGEIYGNKLISQLYRHISITPYLNKRHFISAYYAEFQGEEEEFKRDLGINIHGFKRNLHVDEIGMYISQKNLESFLLETIKLMRNNELKKMYVSDKVPQLTRYDFSFGYPPCEGDEKKLVKIIKNWKR